jgi:4-diphosphocytidyl-2-C-methyl-D-erythritol kinase
VFYPIRIHDEIEIQSIDGQPATCLLSIEGAPIEGDAEKNLVVRAYRALSAVHPLPPVSITLHKQIPMQAGLGGGSADAAFTVKTLNERFKLELTIEQMENYCSQLGADCPFFIQNKPVFATGIGNVFHPVELNLKYKQLVLVKPDIFVSTKDAYAKVKVQHPKKQLPELLAQPIETWKDTVVNDFETSVFSKYPEIAAIKDQMYDLGAVYASMSGSGSSVFGIFEDPVDNIDEKFSGMFCRQREL